MNIYPDLLKFPDESVPLLQNPWKCLAAVPISCQVIKVAGIFNEYYHFIDADIPVVAFEGVATFITHILLEEYMCRDEFRDSHLLKALYTNCILTTLNFGFDLTSSTLKVSHAAITAFLQWGLISYANKDNPMELTDLVAFEMRNIHNSHNDEFDCDSLNDEYL